MADLSRRRPAAGPQARAPRQTFNDRSAVLVNTSDIVAVLTSVRRLGTTGELLGGRTYVALGTAASGPVTGAGGGLPPRDYQAAGSQGPRRLPSPAGDVRSRPLRRGYEVTYRVGETEYRTELPHAVAVCGPPSGRCNADALLRHVLADASAARDGLATFSSTGSPAWSGT